ncbi:hypothetical protein HID58_021579 [Brassica napus]|uniref:Cytochrome c-type biogenesis protein n=1 Tax=Brassica napus TaxID=3708 RepID=A0ABQ8CZ57_BRANA|nr:hypothetical protein HID58_021579 [Brassica napus]
MEVMICLNECAVFTSNDQTTTYIAKRFRKTAKISGTIGSLAAMEKRDEDLKKAQMLDARARNISHNVRCTECGSQSIEDSQADVAILLRQLIRDEIGAGKTDKEIYSKLEDEFGETVLYAPKFDMQTAALWLTPVLIAGGTAAGLVYSKHRQRTNVHIMALDLIRGVSLTPKERVTILDLLIPPPPPPQGVASRLRRWLNLR